jgi:hypothetical protein
VVVEGRHGCWVAVCEKRKKRLESPFPSPPTVERESKCPFKNVKAY